MWFCRVEPEGQVRASVIILIADFIILSSRFIKILIALSRLLLRNGYELFIRFVN